LEDLIWQATCLGSLARFIYRRFWLTIINIPDKQLMWRSVCRPEQVESDGSLKPGFFKDKSGVSCDLSRFSTVERSRRGYGLPPWPIESGLIEFQAGEVKAASSQISWVEHKPSRRLRNYSHSQFSAVLTRQQSKQLIQKSKVLVNHGFKK